MSNACHSGESSSTFASAAQTPPCAVPVCERVGYSFEITAVFTRSDASIAARRPAPPAPTITASYVWKVVIAQTVPGHWLGSNVNTTTVPRTNSANPITKKAMSTANRTAGHRT